MTRRAWMLLAVAVCGCRASRPPMDVFPETVAAVWHRTALRDVAASESPDPVPRTAVARLQSASYQGPGRLEARAYELTSEPAGLDLVQRWRPSADTVFFWAKRYFVVVKWEQADRHQLQAFVAELEKRLNGAK